MEIKIMKEIKLTKRGQAVANQKADTDKQWYERYFSEEYYAQKEWIENLIKTIEDNTDENISLFTPVYSHSSLKKDVSIQRGITLRITLAKKNLQLVA